MVELDLEIANRSNSAIAYESCGTSLERLIGNEWTRVWLGICSLTTGEGVRIEAQGKTTVPLRIPARLGYGVSTEWRAPVQGTYRVSVTLAGSSKVVPRGESTVTFQLR